jgi:hypothetical protein
MNLPEKADYLKESWEGMDKAERARLVREIVDGCDVKRAHLAAYLGIHHSSINRLYDYSFQLGDEPDEPAAAMPPEKEQYEYKGDQLAIELGATRIKTLEELVERCQVDLDKWEVVSFKVKKWDAYAAQKATSVCLENRRGQKYIGWERGETKIIVEPLWAVSATFKKKLAQIAVRDELEAMKAEFKQFAPVYEPILRPAGNSGNMLEVNICDHHLGKLGWHEETGYSDYDLKIAEKLFDDAVDSTIARTTCYAPEKIVFVVGNDLLNFDNFEATTTKGTPVACDSRFPKVYRTTRILITRSVEKLRRIAPVRVVMVPGNHDRLANFTLGDALEVQFARCPDVEIDNQPRTDKYYQHGKCMLMWLHGNTGKLEDYPLFMATQQPKMWGETIYREAHTGDKHQRKLIELHGVAVRILPTLCAPDDWHATQKFTGNIRMAEAYVWNADTGLIGTIVHNLPAEQQLAA